MLEMAELERCIIIERDRAGSPPASPVVKRSLRSSRKWMVRLVEKFASEVVTRRMRSRSSGSIEGQPVSL